MNSISKKISTTILAGLLAVATISVVFGVKSSDIDANIFWRSIFISFGALLIQTMVAWFGGQSARERIHALSISIFSFSSTGLLFFVDKEIAQYGIAILAPVLLWFAEKDRRHRESVTSAIPVVLSVFPFVSAFFFFSLSMATQINFSLPQLLFVLIFGVISGIIATDTLLLSKTTNTRSVGLYGLTIGIFFMQFAWFSYFWPFGYLTTAVVGLSILYAFSDMFVASIEGEFDTKRFASDATIAFVLSGIVLLSTPWGMMG